MILLKKNILKALLIFAMHNMTNNILVMYKK